MERNSPALLPLCGITMWSVPIVGGVLVLLGTAGLVWLKL